MTVEELLEHADQLEADLSHKRREIKGRNFSSYSQETLLRQCDALAGRVSEIRQECQVIQVRAAVAAGRGALAA